MLSQPLKRKRLNLKRSVFKPSQRTKNLNLLPLKYYKERKN